MKSGQDEHFSKKERLCKRREFLLVQQQGRKIHLRDLLVFLYPHLGSRRLGITVSRRVGGAVQRNRFKRLVREVWRRHHDKFPSDIDMVVVAKRSAVHIDSTSLQQQLFEVRKKCSLKDHVSQS